MGLGVGELIREIAILMPYAVTNIDMCIYVLVNLTVVNTWARSCRVKIPGKKAWKREELISHKIRKVIDLLSFVSNQYYQMVQVTHIKQ